MKKKHSQDPVELRKLQEYNDLVNHKKEIIKFSFLASETAEEIKKVKYSEDELRFSMFLNNMMIENQAKKKRIKELDELMAIEDQDVYIDRSTIRDKSNSNAQHKKILSMSINMAPSSCTTKLQVEVAALLKEIPDVNDPDGLDRRLLILEDTYTAVSTEIVKEDENTEALKAKYSELLKETKMLNLKCKETSHLIYSMSRQYQDIDRVRFTARNQMVLSKSSLLAMKEEVSSIRREGAEYLKQKKDEQENNLGDIEFLEAQYSKMLADIEMSKKRIQSDERRISLLEEQEKQIIQKIVDSDLVLKYIDILNTLHKAFVQKEIGREQTESRNSVESRKSQLKQRRSVSLWSSQKSNFLLAKLLKNPLHKVIEDDRRRSFSVASSFDGRERTDEGTHRSSVFIPNERHSTIQKITTFFDDHGGSLETLTNNLLQHYQGMLKLEADLKQSYEDLTNEKIRKEVLMDELIKQAEKLSIAALRLNDLEDKIIETGPDNDKDQNIELAFREKLSSTSQVSFEMKEIAPHLSNELLHNKFEAFLYRGYLYVIDMLTRMPEIVKQAFRMSAKLSLKLQREIDEIIGIVSNMTKNSLNSSKRLEGINTLKRKQHIILEQRPTIGSFGQLPRQISTVTDDENITQRNGRHKGQIPTLILLGDEDPEDLAKQIFEWVNNRQHMLPLLKANLRERFLRYFPEAHQQADQWAENLRSDLIIPLVVDPDTLDDYLERKKAEYDATEAPEKAVEDLISLKEGSYHLLNENFGLLFEKVKQLMLTLKEETEELINAIGPQRSLTSLGKGNRSEALQQITKERINHLCRTQEGADSKERTRKALRLRPVDGEKEFLKTGKMPLDTVVNGINQLTEHRRTRAFKLYSQLFKKQAENQETAETSNQTDSPNRVSVKAAEVLKSPVLSAQKTPEGRSTRCSLDNTRFFPSRVGTRAQSRKASQVEIQEAGNREKVPSSEKKLNKYLEEERENIKKEQERIKLALLFNPDGAEGPSRRNYLKGTESFENQLAGSNPVKKIHESAKLLTRLSKLERTSSVADIHPAHDRIKNYVPRTPKKFILSFSHAPSPSQRSPKAEKRIKARMPVVPILTTMTNSRENTTIIDSKMPITSNHPKSRMHSLGRNEISSKYYIPEKSLNTRKSTSVTKNSMRKVASTTAPSFKFLSPNTSNIISEFPFFVPNTLNIPSLLVGSIDDAV